MWRRENASSVASCERIPARELRNARTVTLLRVPGMPLHAIRQLPPNPKENVMANPFVHVELHTKDVAAAKIFYSTLFGW